MNEHHEGVAAEILESLVIHRLLSTRQVGEMHAPGTSRQWVSRHLNGLRSQGLVDRALTRTRPPEAVWFATQQGRAGAGLQAGSTGRVVTPESATGPLTAHLLGVNEVGLAFMRAARARGDECGPLAWRHEVAHRTPDGKSGALVVADAVLEYFLFEPEREVLMNRFIELDRGTEPPQRLAEKLTGYVRLHRDLGSWRHRYGSFPPLMVVFAGRPRFSLERRRRTAVALCRSDPRLRSGLGEVPMMFALLEDLRTSGPFGPVFTAPEDPDVRVDVLGSPVRPAVATGTEGGAE
ncbi:MAG: replication-relaxation family protein [Haloechinothrix sp.]